MVMINEYVNVKKYAIMYLYWEKKRLCVLSKLLQVVIVLITVEILQTLIVLCLEPNQINTEKKIERHNIYLILKTDISLKYHAA